MTGSLVVRRRMQAAAEVTEWSDCDAPSTTAEIERCLDGHYDLVIVDLAEPCGERVSDSVAVAEAFARRTGTLLVICGSDENVDEELWARQLGAWAFLPGGAPGDSLIALFREAGRLSARWTALRGAVSAGATA